MKLSVITMHNFPNYGSVLQAFATQEKLKEYSYDVEIIDYSGGNSTVGRSLINYLLLGFSGNLIKAFIRLPIRLRKRIVYNGFARHYLNMTANRYTTEEDFENFPVHDGFYCTGSDQVWNPFYKENMPFFLNFIPKDRNKFAYAVSFGNFKEERLNSDEIDKIKDYVDQYKYISVREERALFFLKEQLDYQNAIQLVDPTLAMPPEFWRKFAPKSKKKSEYILLYKLGKEKSFELFAKEISKRTGLPLFRFCSQNFEQLKYGADKNIILPSVFHFVTLIDNAKYVITDSFHGTAFSMSLNTELLVYREEYDGDRISDFLRTVGQERRYIKSCDNFDILSYPTDFDYVNKVLAEERKRVDAYLSNIFGER